MITQDDVLKLAALACLELSDGEIPLLTNKLNAILTYIEQLKEIDLTNVEPMSHVHGSYNILREDNAQEYGEQEAILANAPDRSGRFIRVPIIIAQ